MKYQELQKFAIEAKDSIYFQGGIFTDHQHRITLDKTKKKFTIDLSSASKHIPLNRLADYTASTFVKRGYKKIDQTHCFVQKDESIFRIKVMGKGPSTRIEVRQKKRLPLQFDY